MQVYGAVATHGGPANGSSNADGSAAAAFIDLRSDTQTRPTRAMREAMLEAEVGDDVYGEDPTVNQLQRLAAQVMGKEAALFVTSGTMGNLAAVLAHCPRGAEVLVGDESHVYHYEAGGMSALGGVAFHVVRTAPNGELPIEELERAVRSRPAADAHAAPPGAVCIETTHNRCGGPALSLDYMRRLKSWADSKGLAVHLDGARIFNAAVALGVDVADIAACATTVQFCLSKGLGAPVGSLLVGPADFIARAHRLRKQLGGGMRQAGVLAAPGLLALTQSPKRLHEDHANARALAEGLAALPRVAVDLDLVHTNIVVFRPPEPWTAAEFVARLREHGVLVVPFKDGVRAVTHCDVDAEGCRRALAAVQTVLGST